MSDSEESGQTVEASAPGGAAVDLPRSRSSVLAYAVFLLFPALALLLLSDVLLGGRLLLPAEYLKGFLPWSLQVSGEAAGAAPQWNVLQWDGMAEFFPWRLFAARSISEGRIPLWDPYVLCGTPFLANSQSAPLYPLHLLLYLPPDAGTPLTVATRMAWLAFVHLSLAGAFTYILARQMCLRPLAAAMAGITFELSGFAVAWLELPSFISVTCWIPLAMACLVQALRKHSLRWAVGAGVATGMMLLAGHLQVAFYGLLALGLLWTWEVANLSREVRGADPSPTHGPEPIPASWHSNVLIGVKVGILMLVIGFLLAAPQFLSSMELSRISHRVGTPTEKGYAEYIKLALPLQNWITLLVPDYYGLSMRGDYWAYWNYGPPNILEYAGYVGSAAFLLVALGLIVGNRLHRRSGYFILLGVFALLLAAGSPLDRLFYFAVPGFAQSGSPARSLVLFCLCQAMLAGAGLEWILARTRERWSTIVLPIVGSAIGVGVMMFVFHLLAQAGIDRLQLVGREVAQLLESVSIPALIRSIGFLVGTAFLLCLMAWLFRDNQPNHRAAAVGGCAIAAVAGVLILLGGAYNPTTDPAMLYPATLWTDTLRSSGARVATLNEEWRIDAIPRALLPPNASIAYGYRDAQGYDSLWLGSYRRIADAVNDQKQGASPPLNGNIVFMKDPASPLFPLLGARYVISKTPLNVSGLQIPPGSPAGPPYLYEDRRALPEGYLVPEWVVADDGQALVELRRRGGDLGRFACISPASGTSPQTAGKGSSTGIVPVNIERRGPGEIRAQVDARVHSLVVLSEGYAPGWKATVQCGDSPPVLARIERTNVAFQGVVVQAGTSAVTWRYLPDSFRTGLFFMLIAAMVVTGVSVARPRTRELSR